MTGLHSGSHYSVHALFRRRGMTYEEAELAVMLHYKMIDDFNAVATGVDYFSLTNLYLYREYK